MMSTLGMLDVSEIVGNAVNYVWYGGIYFLIDGDQIVYVGRSENVFSRIARHNKERRKKFDKIYTIRVDDEKERDLLEIEYIVNLAPKYNKSIPYSDKWTTIYVLLRDLYGKNIHEYIKQNNIQNTNGYYLASDFASLYPEG